MKVEIEEVRKHPEWARKWRVGQPFKTDKQAKKSLLASQRTFLALNLVIYCSFSDLCGF
jgi:hypothetical protein